MSPDASEETGDASEAAVDTAIDSSPTCGDETCVISDVTGIFVTSYGDDSYPGTRDKPVRTLGHAQALAGSTKYVFACAETFSETLVLTDGLRLVGGLSCAGGSWGAPTGMTTINAPASPAIRALALEKGALLANLKVIAPDGKVSGESSIGLFAANAKNLRVIHSSVTAGYGAGGANGAAGADATGTATDGSPGYDSMLSIDYESFAGTTKMTGGFGGTLASIGGRGGSSYTGTAFSEDAENGGAASGTLGCGLGGRRATAGGSCIAGQKGCVGTPGTKGAGGLSVGTLSLSGYQATNAGEAGGDGAPGGGGGGGSAGRRTLPGSSQVMGGSGGGGGGGGFPGAGGKAGTPGGASIAILSFQSSVAITASQLTTKGGGTGGSGGPGGFGNAGGKAGAGGKALSGYSDTQGCEGGTGGKGGDGGSGGGGGGGPSVGLGFAGASPVITDVSISTGLGGTGGASAGNAGANGARADSLSF